jgi:hypothetical protein
MLAVKFVLRMLAAPACAQDRGVEEVLVGGGGLGAKERDARGCDQTLR